MGNALTVVGGTKAKPAKRKTISQKTRFEVFKRDSFKCQYCGRCAPEVILNVDHIHPVSKGGEDDIMNYITSCFDCNSGKSDRLLSDDSVIAKQRGQLEELNERREQLEMMLKWREGLRDIDDVAIDKVADTWSKLAKGWSLNEAGRNSARKMIKDFGIAAVLDAMDVAARQYFKYGVTDEPTDDSVQTAFSRLGGICRLSSQPDDVRQLYYARGILRKRVYVNESYVMDLMKDAIKGGMPIEDLLSCARCCRNWTDFQATLHTWTE